MGRAWYRFERCGYDLGQRICGSWALGKGVPCRSQCSERRHWLGCFGSRKWSAKHTSWLTMICFLASTGCNSKTGSCRFRDLHGFFKPRVVSVARAHEVSGQVGIGVELYRHRRDSACVRCDLPAIPGFFTVMRAKRAVLVLVENTSPKTKLDNQSCWREVAVGTEEFARTTPNPRMAMMNRAASVATFDDRPRDQADSLCHGKSGRFVSVCHWHRFFNEIRRNDPTCDAPISLRGRSSLRDSWSAWRCRRKPRQPMADRRMSALRLRSLTR